ncbi:iron complex outermembrane receptor protein [Sphingomonas jinjuensis]|uniref:Iron complex outermembrane receptor protein n=1 Tax=Sphingomonas jinjuensis TaxID=535907 RepID=A0A840EYR4_9SPHN|nr:TonB-dependent receptor [Sphingomonas jinjuensis]MBB4152153.1 iron complex outermembrane receptor protein [Sphingomonas jinjuensis]
MISPSTRVLLTLGTAAAALLAMPASAQVSDSSANRPSPAASPDSTATDPTAAVSNTTSEAQDSAITGTGDIVVTARRREETLLNVPIAVSAFTSDKLAKIGAIDVTDLQNVTPNTSLKAARGTNSTLTAFIRGVGQQDPVPGFESGVGVYLDDVYLNRPQAAVLDIYDVDRIEVLRGPQGTLYGRNTIGGAVKYVTRRLADGPEARVRATYGTFNQADGVISLSTPIGDMLKVGIAGARLTRDGFGRNLNLNIDNYNKNIWAGRGTIEFETPDKRLFVRLTSDYTHDKSNPRNGHRLIPGLLSGLPVLDNVFDTRAGLNNPRQDVEAGGLSLSANAQLTDHLTLRSISAWRKDKTLTPIDFDSNPAVDVDVPAVYRNEQTSQEFQLLYNSEKLNGLVGYYYLGAKASTAFDVLLFTTGGTALPGLDAFTAGDVRTETSSFFGDFTYDFTPWISLSLGGRYTWDERKSFVFKQNYLNGPTANFGGNPIALGAPATNFRGRALYKRFTPRASLQIKPWTDQMIYASYAEGFKGGGFDPRGSATQALPSNRAVGVTYQDIYDYLSFDPETVKTYEIGWKGQLFDRRLSYALDGFYSKYTDVQVPGSSGCLVNGVATFCGITTNAAKATIKGVEAESTAVLARDFAGVGSAVNLSGTLGYIDAKYDRFIGPTGTDVAAYRFFQNTPEWTVSGTLTGVLPVGEGLLTANSTVAYRSLTHQFEVASPFLDQPGYTLWDAGLTYQFGADRRYSIGVYGRNLTDVKYKIGGYQYLAANAATGVITRTATGGVTPTLGREGVATAFYGAPRQVFGTFTARF